MTIRARPQDEDNFQVGQHTHGAKRTIPSLLSITISFLPTQVYSTLVPVSAPADPSMPTEAQEWLLSTSLRRALALFFGRGPRGGGIIFCIKTLAVQATGGGEARWSRRMGMNTG